MSLEHATVEELQQAIVERKQAQKEQQRKDTSENFIENGLVRFQSEVHDVNSIEDAYKLANRFVSRYVHARKVLGLPVGQRGRKKN